MRSVVIIVLACVTGCRTTDATRQSAEVRALESDLIPIEFGQEQVALYGIRSSISFEPADSAGTRVGVVQARGEEFEVRRDDTDDTARTGVDRDRNGRFEAAELKRGATTEHRLQFGSERVLVEICNAGPESEYLVRELWTARLEHGGEDLALGALRFGANSILFVDTDLDGVFESFLASDSPIALGGSSWDLMIDYDERQARLQATDRAPVTTGFPAPRTAGRSLGTDEAVDLVVDGATNVLVFCHAECAGCQLIAAGMQRVQADYADDPSVRFIAVSQTHDLARRTREQICPGFEHVISNAAWSDYAVRPTPTIVVIGSDGTIAYRGMGQGVQTEAMLREQIRAVR